MVMNYGGGMFPQQRSPYDSMFAPRPDMGGPVGSQGFGFGMPPSMSAPTPGTQGILGPQGMGAQGMGGMLQQSPQQQQPGAFNLSPQMIQQIMAALGIGGQR